MDPTGILAILLVIGGPMAIAITAIISEHRAKQKRYEAMVKAIELGKSPDEVKMMFGEEKGTGSKDVNRRLVSGIIVIGIAIGLAAWSVVTHQGFMFGGTHGHFMLGASVFLLFLGAAFIVVWLINRPKAK